MHTDQVPAHQNHRQYHFACFPHHVEPFSWVYVVGWSWTYDLVQAFVEISLGCPRGSHVFDSWWFYMTRNPKPHIPKTLRKMSDECLFNRSLQWGTAREPHTWLPTIWCWPFLETPIPDVVHGSAFSSGFFESPCSQMAYCIWDSELSWCSVFIVPLSMCWHHCMHSHVGVVPLFFVRLCLCLSLCLSLSLSSVRICMYICVYIYTYKYIVY